MLQTDPQTISLQTALVAGLGSVVGAALALTGSLLVARIQARTTLNAKQTDKEIELEKAIHSTASQTELTIAQIADGHLKTVLELQQKQITGLMEANEAKTSRIAEDEKTQRENIQKIDKLQEHSESCERILRQTEKQLRFYDEALGVIRWEADVRGKLLYVNKHFLKCTGLPEAQLIGDEFAWFSSIRERDIEHIESEWARLLAGHTEEIKVQFLFVSQVTNELTPVTAEIEPIYGVGREVYKFTARTKPMFLINAELINENRRLTEENRGLIEKNLQLQGRSQNE